MLTPGRTTSRQSEHMFLSYSPATLEDLRDHSWCCTCQWWTAVKDTSGTSVYYVTFQQVPYRVTLRFFLCKIGLVVGACLTCWVWGSINDALKCFNWDWKDGSVDNTSVPQVPRPHIQARQQCKCLYSQFTPKRRWQAETDSPQKLRGQLAWLIMQQRAYLKHAEKWELIPEYCPLSSTCMLGHVPPHTIIYIHIAYTCARAHTHTYTELRQCQEHGEHSEG